MKDAKYLLAYVAPLAAIFGIYMGGYWSPGSFYIAFILIPLLELVSKGSQENFEEEEEASRTKLRFFDFLLYFNVPLLYGILVYFFYTLASRDLSGFEIAGMTVSVGVLCSTIGINVAHELGHRTTWYEQLMSKMLLLTALYMHFIIEHNWGHHKNVSTDEDPASSRYGENIYAFFFRSVTMSYIGAWKIEASRLKKSNKAFFSVYNQMIWFQLIQVAYLLSVAIFFSIPIMLLAIAAGVIGFLLLETVNYIEHYGLRRKKLDSGRYEVVKPWHSWNSNHEMGRIFLYELTRHSDHHYKASRKFQILRHFDESPQLPYGYPGSMLLALVPPLWFSIMNKEVQKFQEYSEKHQKNNKVEMA